MTTQEIIDLIELDLADNNVKNITPAILRNVVKKLAVSAKIYPVGELQIFKVPGSTNNEILEAGDYCIGFVEGQMINANYIAGDRTLLASYDI